MAAALVVEEVEMQEKKKKWGQKVLARRAQRWRDQSSSKATWKEEILERGRGRELG